MAHEKQWEEEEEEDVVDADGFPSWWNVCGRPDRIRCLRTMGVHCTYDLLAAAAEHTDVQVGNEGARLAIGVTKLFGFCNRHLARMRVCLRRARDEKGVLVEGRSPHTVLFADLIADALPPPLPPPAGRLPLPAGRLPPPQAMQPALGQAAAPRAPALSCALRTILCCPITHEVFVDPVVTCDGHTYERGAIVAWFLARDTSPMTGDIVCSKAVYPNYAIKSLVASTDW